MKIAKKQLAKIIKEEFDQVQKEREEAADRKKKEEQPPSEINK